MLTPQGPGRPQLNFSCSIVPATLEVTYFANGSYCFCIKVEEACMFLSDGSRLCSHGSAQPFICLLTGTLICLVQLVHRRFLLVQNGCVTCRHQWLLDPIDPDKWFIIRSFEDWQLAKGPHPVDTTAVPQQAPNGMNTGSMRRMNR